MTVRYVHIRLVDSQGQIQPNGGLTIAYTICKYGDKFDFIAAWSQCIFSEIYRYQWVIGNTDGKDYEVTEEILSFSELEETLEEEQYIIGRINETLEIEKPDMFCKKTGRELALKYLQDKEDDSRVHIIEGDHPYGVSVAQKLCTLLFGAIEVKRDKKGRLVSDFQPQEIH